MNWDKKITAVLIIALMLFQPIQHFAHADSKLPQSKRIEVYSLSQNYWDTESGETLGEIVRQLLPYNKAMQQRLMQDIIELNPNGFRENNPDYMQADTRLWLPNSMSKADSQVDTTHFSVQSFSWGNIKRPRR
jgi:hypothetical protein